MARREDQGGLDGPVPPQKGDAGEPESPADLGKRDWRETLTPSLKEMKADRVTFISGGLAMFWFLAVFPAIVAAVGLLGLVGASSQTLSAGIEETLPGDAALLGLGLALWSASSGRLALQTGLNVAYTSRRSGSSSRRAGSRSS